MSMHQQRGTYIHKENINRHEGKINYNTVIVGDFNTLLTEMDRLSRQKINKEILTLHDVRPDELDINRGFHPKTAK